MAAQAKVSMPGLHMSPKDRKSHFENMFLTSQGMISLCIVVIVTRIDLLQEIRAIDILRA